MIVQTIADETVDADLAAAKFTVLMCSCVYA